jgi:hypothetical protein
LNHFTFIFAVRNFGSAFFFKSSHCIGKAIENNRLSLSDIVLDKVFRADHQVFPGIVQFLGDRDEIVADINGLHIGKVK